VTEDEIKAAGLAGWHDEDKPPPFTHTLPPPNDPVLGHNGIKPTGAEILETS